MVLRWSLSSSMAMMPFMIACSTSIRVSTIDWHFWGAYDGDDTLSTWHWALKAGFLLFPISCYSYLSLNLDLLSTTFHLCHLPRSSSNATLWRCHSRLHLLPASHILGIILCLLHANAMSWFFLFRSSVLPSKTEGSNHVLFWSVTTQGTSAL